MEIILLYLNEVSAGGVNRGQKRQSGNVLGNKGSFEGNGAVPKWLRERFAKPKNFDQKLKHRR